MTAPRARTDGPCPTPLDAVALMDYWLGVLSAADENAVEEHLLACDECGDRLRVTIALAEGLQTLARSGSLQVVISDRLLQEAVAKGQRVREYAPPPGGSVQCTVAADDDLLVARLAADLTSAARVDLSWCDDQGAELLRMTDIPVRRDAGTVVIQQSITVAKASESNTLVARLVAVGRDGERTLGEYAFHHTRTIPGPGRRYP